MNKQTQDMISMFDAFMADDNADAMYVTGAAGTGKTTDLKHIIQHCIDEKIEYVVTAYTHKAVGILRSKMPKKAELATLHSFLRKRPSINTNATKLAHVDTNVQTAEPERVKVVFIDEFSMVGEKDYESITEMQCDEETGKLLTKVVYLGDLNQLPPVKDMQTIKPRGPYHTHLTKVYRQADSNPLLDTLTYLSLVIGGQAPARPLAEHETFKRGADILAEYKRADDAILLAYTNKRVQYMNAEIMGRDKPIHLDEIFSSTTREKFVFDGENEKPQMIMSIMGDLVELGSKFKTLETLKTLPVDFYDVEDEDGMSRTIACVFGHQNFIDVKQKLAQEATTVNQLIEAKYKMKAAHWARENYQDPLAKRRAKAWREMLSFNSNVQCVDFNHAMTVHKSQGSTFDTVCLDIQDLGLCADKDYKLYLKLLYVALSRSSNKVYTT